MEKSTKITKSNSHSGPHPHGSGAPPETVTPLLHAQWCQCLATISEKNSFLVIKVLLLWYTISTSRCVSKAIRTWLCIPVWMASLLVVDLLCFKATSQKGAFYDKLILKQHLTKSLPECASAGIRVIKVRKDH